MILSEHKSNEQGLSDLLNYAHFIDEGILLNKDGALLITYKYSGPDINSSTGTELDGLTSSFNRVATSLEDGWMLHVDELRIPSITYPKQGYFPNSVAALIDDERRSLYEAEDEHYENQQFITFVWKFPMPKIKTARHWFVDGLAKEDEQNLNRLLEQFKEIVERCKNLLSSHLILEQLNSKALLSYLNTCITGDLLPVGLPPDGCFIDVVLGRKPLVGGQAPKIGNKYIQVLSVVGYVNQETIPGLLEHMCTYPMVYRWSNRFIPFSEQTAEREIRRYQKSWNNKVKGLLGLVREAISGKPTQRVNQDALQMSEQTQEAMTANSNHSVRFGYWTSEIVLIDESESLISQAAKELSKYLDNLGFNIINETVNVLDAWLGTIPGHGSCNVRRLFLSSVNLAHVLPLSTIWAGLPHSDSASKLPPKSPPVFYAATTGKIPFRFNMDVSDVGHQVVIGPTGAGKSTYLDLLIAQFLRYKDAQVFIFDKDFSHEFLAKALGGYHYDIGESEEPLFCPLADLTNSKRRQFAKEFIETLVTLQNVHLTPVMRTQIHEAIEQQAESSRAKRCDLTTISQSGINDIQVRSALNYYTTNGQFNMLDAKEDKLKMGYLQTFEMGWLLSRRPEVYLPVLKYIFGQIELNLDESNGSKPTLIILEEAWQYMAHPVFASQIVDWLKTLRKKNARVVFVTQALTDLYDPKAGKLNEFTAPLIDSCKTKIFLPNDQMDSTVEDLYRQLQLNDRQIELIKESTPKRHYYVVTSEGRRLIDLGLNKNSMALAFIGHDKKKVAELKEYQLQYKDEWVYYWLKKHNHSAWAKYWHENYLEGVVA